VADLGLKAPLASPTFTGTVTLPTPFTLGAVSVTPTGTELNFVDGVTSAIQGQIDGKAATAHNHAGADINSGTVADARLSANVSLLGSTIGGAELGNPAVGTKGGVESKLCNGTDKVSSIGTDGIPVCTADQTGGGGGVAFREFKICGVVNACITWTNLVATYVEGANQASRTNIDLSRFTDFRVLTNFSVAAVTGDLQIHCADTTAFSPQTLLYQLDNPAANALVVGAWTTLPAGCKTAGGVFIRAGMINGNTTEDPAARRIQIQVR